MTKKTPLLTLLIGMLSLSLLTGCSSSEINDSSALDSSVSSSSNEIITEDFDICLEGSSWTLSFSGSVDIPSDHLNVYEGDVFSISTPSDKEAFVEAHFPDFTSKKDLIQHTSSIDGFGDIFKYLDSNSSNFEKLQFLTDQNILYYRYPDASVETASSEIKDDCFDFISQLFESISLDKNYFFENPDSAYSEDNCVSFIYLTYLDNIPALTTPAPYSGDDQFHTGEWISVLADHNGVYKVDNSVLLVNHQITKTYSSDEFMHPEDILQFVLEYIDTPYFSNCTVTSMTLYYITLPIRSTDPSKRMCSNPVWEVQYYSDLGGKSAINSLFFDAITGELYVYED